MDVFWNFAQALALCGLVAIVALLVWISGKNDDDDNWPQHGAAS